MKKCFGFILSCFLLISLIGCSKATVKEQDVKSLLSNIKSNSIQLQTPILLQMYPTLKKK
ncbi:hypothetical protein [Heyndrickxia oleronia]|uniref:hypothetical protein n=1 Tax=Heyndrickxia oleronia TaxID=38875 RepID=UPI0037529999